MFTSDTPTTPHNDLKVSNPQTSEELTDSEQNNPGHHPQSPEQINEKSETKSDLGTNADKTTPNSRTLYNPDKPEKPTDDSQASKDIQQSGNHASTGIRLDNKKG